MKKKTAAVICAMTLLTIVGAFFCIDRYCKGIEKVAESSEACVKAELALAKLTTTSLTGEQPALSDEEFRKYFVACYKLPKDTPLEGLMEGREKDALSSSNLKRMHLGTRFTGQKLCRIGIFSHPT